MAGYAVTARVERPDLRAGGAVRVSGARSRAERVAVGRAEAVDLTGRPLDDVLRERWDGLRTFWSQTTFFLFDPDSWR